MTFEKYCNGVIEDFIEDVELKLCLELTQDQKDDIYTAMEEHKECFEKEYESFCKEDAEMIISVIYSESVAIECMNCNETIIDTDVLFSGNE